MVSGEVWIRNSSGFHACPSSMLVWMVSGIKYGTVLVIVCEGREETEALQAMIRIIENGPGE